MKKILFFTLLLISMATAYSQIKSENLFYMVDSPSSFRSFKENADQISIICPQTFNVSAEGVVYGSVDRRVLEIAKAKNIKVMPLLVNKGFDQQLLHKIVSDSIVRKRSIEMMLEYAERYGLDGWQFDLEGLHISDRDNFTLYFRETAEALHKNNLQLSAALVHMLENVGGPSEYQLYLYENWRAGYAAQELSEIGDFLSIMTYDQHTRRTPPGPVSGPGWMEEVVKYLLDEGVPPQKLSLGIPTYSVHWYADYSESRGGFQNGRQVGYDMVEHLLGQNDASIQWHEEGGCNYALWENGGAFEYIFIEDGMSLEPKLDILEKYELRGISFWRLGTEAPDFWTVLSNNVKKK
ncbi:MAG: glycosyl hydrolase family 18 protein [Bacteroidota bacterium]|nr:glycosyl hydrolase family 18 protein [Bacteroidota bacterium]